MTDQNPKLKLEVRPTIRSRSPRELLIFSLDDTLIDTSLYWLVRTAYAWAAAAKEGKAGEKALPVAGDFEAWDPAKKLTYEMGPIHGSVSMQEIWRAFQEECEIPPTSDTDLSLRLARSLRSKFPLPIVGAEDLLKWAHPHFTLVLFTCGDPGVQQEKVEAARLGEFFNKIKVVPSKGKEEFPGLDFRDGLQRQKHLGHRQFDSFRHQSRD